MLRLLNRARFPMRLSVLPLTALSEYDKRVSVCDAPACSRQFFTKLFSAPQAQKEKSERSACNQKWTDNYQWLEEGGERLREYLESETEYTKKYLKQKLKHLKSIRNQIREASAPTKDFPEVWWPYEYWTEPSEIDPDDQAFYRKNLEKPNSEPQLLVDTGSLEDDFGQTGVGGMKLCPSQRYLAMLTEFEKGFESYTLHLLDLDEEKVLEDEIIHPNISGCEWSRDSRKIVYTTHDKQNRPNKVWVHVLGTDLSEDQCLLEENDSKFYLHIGTTKCRDYIVITAASKMSCEVQLLNGDVNPPYALTLVQKREPGLEYFVESWKNKLVILTNNTKTGNYALCTTTKENPDKKHWKIVVDENESFAIEDLEMNTYGCVLLTRTFEGLRIKVLDLDQKDIVPMDVPLPSWCKQITLGANLDFYSKHFTFFVSSPIHKARAFDYNFTSGECSEDPLHNDPGALRSSDYICKTEVAKAQDGTMIPVTLAYKKTLNLDGSNPCLLEVYGAYGHALDLTFLPHRTPLLANGWIMCFGHVRGGGEFGRKWHKAGRLETKMNSVSDCYAVMQHMIAQRYTSEGQIVLESFSAGGVVAGAIINNYPSMLLASVLQAPFLDILTTLTDEKQPLTVHEYEEWGNPNIPDDFQRIKDLCPYQNIKPNNYPSIFVSCGYNDSRVPVWGPAKWVAKIKENQKGDSKIFLYTDFEGGHFSVESERNGMRDLQYSFIVYLWEQYQESKYQKRARVA